MNYTQLCLIALPLLLFLDFFSGSKLYKNKYFYGIILFTIVMQTIVDNYLNGRWGFDSYIVGPYNSKYYSGIKIIETPIENYLFGIELIYLNIINYEYITKRK